jgi:hypothetical protein
VAQDRRDEAALTEVATRKQLESKERQRQEWRWLGLATLGGTLLGALIFWAVAYATGGDSGVITRGGWAAFAAIAGALIGLIVGFMLWALWVLLHTLGWRFSHRR